jgi:hypothetical protein
MTGGNSGDGDPLPRPAPLFPVCHLGMIIEHKIFGVNLSGGIEFLDRSCSGPSADDLFVVVEPLLYSLSPRPGSYVIKRYCDPGAPAVRIDL